MAAITICSDSLVLYNFWWLCGGVNGDLPQDGLCHTQHCFTQSPLPLKQATADPYLYRRYSDTVLAQLLWGLWVLVCQRFVWALQASLVGMGLTLNAVLLLLPSCFLLGFLLCPLMWGVFLVGSNILLLTVVQQLVVILEFSREKMSTCPSTPPSSKLSIGNYGPIGICHHSLEIKNFPILIFSFFSVSASLPTFFLSFFFSTLSKYIAYWLWATHAIYWEGKNKCQVHACSVMSDCWWLYRL